MLCAVGDKVERSPIEKLVKDPIEKAGAVRWIGSDEKFFLIAAVPYPEPRPANRVCSARSADGQVGEVVLKFSGRTLAPSSPQCVARITS